MMMIFVISQPDDRSDDGGNDDEFSVPVTSFLD